MARMRDLIDKKRDGLALNATEIDVLVRGMMSGEIPDYQLSAWLMAVVFQGLNKEETIALTKALQLSGDQVDLSAIPGIKVDKHSTGGVGDKTSLVLGPLVAAAGAPVAKLSGRALGHTGGTVDKLESIEGFQVELGTETFIQQVKDIGIAIIGQSANLVPGDKKLYALRDVTGTVNNMGLISSSIMSKKLAGGADAIVLDVKCGNGGFMQSIEDALKLAETMVNIGLGVGKETRAVISNMNQPLGNAVGNSLEVIEAIETLKGNGPTDLVELCVTLGSQMLAAGEYFQTPEAAAEKLHELLQNGEAYNKMVQWVEAQGGNVKQIEYPSLLPGAEFTFECLALNEGTITSIQAAQVGQAALRLGAGRKAKGDPIDYGAGLILHKKVGDFVNKGECIATLHTNTQRYLEPAEQILRQALAFDEAGGNTTSTRTILGMVDRTGRKVF